jgi:hypothetical protein
LPVFSNSRRNNVVMRYPERKKKRVTPNAAGTILFRPACPRNTRAKAMVLIPLSEGR